MFHTLNICTLDISQSSLHACYSLNPFSPWKCNVSKTEHLPQYTSDSEQAFKCPRVSIVEVIRTYFSKREKKIKMPFFSFASNSRAQQTVILIS